jgi:hypothetical protein
MLFCGKCGKEAGEGESFCAKCGNSLKGNATPKKTIAVPQALAKNKVPIIAIAALAITASFLFFVFGNKIWGDFSIIPVKGANGDYQYIDMNQKGKIVISPQFGKAHFFNDGLALVKTSGYDGKWGYIDKKGRYAITPTYSVAMDFFDGVAWVQIEDQPPMLIDKNGKMLLQIDSLTAAYPFANGMSLVNIWSQGQELNIIIDKNGKAITTTEEEISNVNEGFYAFKDKETQKWGFKNMTGETVINPQFDVANMFIDGMAEVRIGEKWGAINKKGDFIINPQYDKLYYDSDGLFLAQIGKKQGLVNKKNEIVINPQYDWLGGFSGNKLAPVEIGNKFAYINRKGQTVINPQFDFALPFLGDYAMVVSRGKIGFINQKGDFIISPLYEDSDNIDEYENAVWQKHHNLPIDSSTKFLPYTKLNEKKEAYREIEREKARKAAEEARKATAETAKETRAVEEILYIPITSSNGFYKYITLEGKDITEAKYVRAYIFQEGRALVQYRDSLWGYIDTDGKTIASGYKQALSFKDGMAWVNHNGTIKALDLNGNTIKTLPRDVISIWSFYEGFALFSSNGTQSYMDKNYNEIGGGNHYFADGNRFQENVASVMCDNGKYGYINTDASFIIGCNFDDAKTFRNSRAIVKAGDSWGVINKQGKYIFGPYSDVDMINPDDDMFKFKKKDGNWGWFNSQGEVVIQPLYEEIMSFDYRDIAPVKQNGLWGYIDKNGVYVIDRQYNVAYPFFNDRALVKIDDNFVTIDKNGKVDLQTESQKIDPSYWSLVNTGIAGGPRIMTVEPSFKCSGSLNNAEKMICRSVNLASLDKTVDELYKRALSYDRSAANLQKEFLAKRNRCENISCLESAYETRKRELSYQ